MNVRRAATALGVATVALASMTTQSWSDAAAWSPTGSMHEAREGGGSGLGTIAAKLPDGRVLVAGGYDAKDKVFSLDKKYFLSSSEIYDPTTGQWSVTNSMHQARYAAVVVTLSTGDVLAAGGSGGINAKPTTTAEVFDVDRERWVPTARMSTCRQAASASALASGAVLVAGGVGCDGVQSSVEVYDPARRKWTMVAPMHHARWGHSATTLPDGRILVAGGKASGPLPGDPEILLSSAEVYDPSTNVWTEVDGLAEARFLHAAGLVAGGKVLVAGGHVAGGDPSPVMGPRTASAELFDPATNMWMAAASMSVGRVEFASAVLPNGTFLAAGGGLASSAEIYNPMTNAWSMTAPMSMVRDDAQLVPLNSGALLIIGGFRVEPPDYITTATTELYHPAS